MNCWDCPGLSLLAQTRRVGVPDPACMLPELLRAPGWHSVWDSMSRIGRLFFLPIALSLHHRQGHRMHVGGARWPLAPVPLPRGTCWRGPAAAMGRAERGDPTSPSTKPLAKPCPSRAAAGVVLLAVSSTARGKCLKTEWDGCNNANIWGFFGFVCLF